PETLPAYAGKQLRNGPWILQPCLVNPPAWQSLTPGPLRTVRVVTGIVARGGEPILVGIHAHLPVQSPFVANTAAGGITVSLDPDTCRMRIGYRWTDRAEDCRVHPVTGGQIEGAVLPDWEALRDLALRAHRAAGDWCMLGWDVASTNQ